MAGIVEALVRAATFFTIDAAGEVTDGETVIIAGKTYTFKATVGTADANVHIGAAVADTVTNLLAAINLKPSQGETGTSGTDYGSLTTRNPNVFAVLTSATVLTIKAHVPGAIGNFITATIGTSTATLDNATLENGTGNIGQFFDEALGSVQFNSEALHVLAPFGFVAGGALD